MSLQNQHSCVDGDHLHVYTETKIYTNTLAFRLIPSMKAICLSSSQSQKTVTKK